MCRLLWRRRRRVSCAVQAITATKGKKKTFSSGGQSTAVLPMGRETWKHSLYSEAYVMCTAGLLLGHLWRWVSLLRPMVSEKSHFPPSAQSSEKPHSGANTYEIPSTVECLSVQAYPFKSTEGELATMICLGLLQAPVQKWRRRRRGKKTTRLSSCGYSE